MANYATSITGTASYIDTPDHVDFDVTDLEVQALVAFTDYTPANDHWVLEKIQSGTDAFYARISDTGQTTPGALAIFDTTNTFEADADPGLTNTVKYWLRWVLDVDNGAADADADFYWSPHTTDDRTAVSWTQLGSTISLGSTTSLGTGNSVLSIGRNNVSGHGALGGNIYQVILLDGIGGSEVAHFNAGDFSVGDNGTDTDTAVDVTGKTWTLRGAPTVIESDARNRFLLLGVP